MSEVLTREEMEARFPSEWILIEEPVTAPSLEVLSGRVAWHSKDRDEVYRKAIDSPARRIAFHYTGTIPENTAIIL